MTNNDVCGSGGGDDGDENYDRLLALRTMLPNEMWGHIVAQIADYDHATYFTLRHTHPLFFHTEAGVVPRAVHLRRCVGALLNRTRSISNGNPYMAIVCAVSDGMLSLDDDDGKGRECAGAFVRELLAFVTTLRDPMRDLCSNILINYGGSRDTARHCVTRWLLQKSPDPYHIRTGPAIEHMIRSGSTIYADALRHDIVDHLDPVMLHHYTTHNSDAVLMAASSGNVLLFNYVCTYLHEWHTSTAAKEKKTHPPCLPSMMIDERDLVLVLRALHIASKSGHARVVAAVLKRLNHWLPSPPAADDYTDERHAKAYCRSIRGAIAMRHYAIATHLYERYPRYFRYNSDPDTLRAHVMRMCVNEDSVYMLRRMLLAHPAADQEGGAVFAQLPYNFLLHAIHSNSAKIVAAYVSDVPPTRFTTEKRHELVLHTVRGRAHYEVFVVLFEWCAEQQYRRNIRLRNDLLDAAASNKRLRIVEYVLRRISMMVGGGGGGEVARSLMSPFALYYLSQVRIEQSRG